MSRFLVHHIEGFSFFSRLISTKNIVLPRGLVIAKHFHV